METPATGMWGPGDFDGFVTIEDLRYNARFDHQPGLDERRFARDRILDLAEDLDARGLVLIDRIDLQRITTADADLETGGE